MQVRTFCCTEVGDAFLMCCSLSLKPTQSALLRAAGRLSAWVGFLAQEDTTSGWGQGWGQGYTVEWTGLQRSQTLRRVQDGRLPPFERSFRMTRPSCESLLGRAPAAPCSFAEPRPTAKASHGLSGNKTRVVTQRFL